MPQSLIAARNRILPALITPLTDRGEVDLGSTERLIDHLYNQGVGGLYVTGSTGEGIFLDVDSRRTMVELAVGLSRDRGQVVAHVGAVEGRVAFELAAHAARAGADAVASIPPFAGGYCWDEIYAYYRRLCEASSVPVVAYYIPSLTGQSLPVDNLASLLRLPNLAGFKVTDTNLYTLDRLRRYFGPEQIVYNGPDELLAQALMMGAHGGIGTTYNFMPRLILEIAGHAAAGRWTEALAAQRRANDVIEVLLMFQPLAATKQILYWQGLIDCPACAAPRASLSDSEKLDLRRRLSETAIADSLVR